MGKVIHLPFHRMRRTGGNFGPFSVKVLRHDGEWIVVCRHHSWSFARLRDAIREGNAIASGFGVNVSYFMEASA